MNVTDVLKLRKPAENDFYSVGDFNHNMDILEAEAAGRIVTLRIEADENSTVAVSHSSGTYSGTATQHTESQDDGTSVTRIYAEFMLPRGGKASFMFTSGGHSFCDSANLMDGALEYIIGSHMTVYQSVLAKVPDNYFKSKSNFEFANEAGIVQIITKVGFDTLQSGYTADIDHQNELWHAVRCGLITSAQYQTITGTAYPSTPPTRVE